MGLIRKATLKVSLVIDMGSLLKYLEIRGENCRSTIANVASHISHINQARRRKSFFSGKHNIFVLLKIKSIKQTVFFTLLNT